MKRTILEYVEACVKTKMPGIVDEYV